MKEGNIFSLFTLAGGEGSVPGLDWGGVPHPRSQWGVSPSKIRTRGTPHPRLDGVPPPPPPIRRQISKASTCYTAGSVLLAFTQEDFLFASIFNSKIVNGVNVHLVD